MYQAETAADQAEATKPVESAVVPRDVARGAPLEQSAAEWVSRQLHREVLERFVPSGSRVLELEAEHGQHTEVLHRLGCKVSARCGSLEELESLRGAARERGFDVSVESWAVQDVCHLEGVEDAAFDAVVALGGALGHALERRDRALAEWMRVLRPRGLLVLGVPSLWGTLHAHLATFMGRDLVHNRAVIRSGNLPEASLGVARPCHLFRAAELEAFLRRAGLELLSLSASSALSTGLALPIGHEAAACSALIEYERTACAERGYLDSGRQLIAVARR